MRQAIIDLGTNTYHLLIVDRDDERVWTEVVRHRIFVKMGEFGVKTIGPAAQKRCLDAMKLFKAQLDAAEVELYNVHAFGTAAFRMASNSKELREQIFRETGIEVRVISGEEEAAAIYRGVLAAVPFEGRTALIMDIGGGSVEFIIANTKDVLWKGSFDIGVSILFQHFHKSDPIADTEVLALQDFLDVSLAPLKSALAAYPCEMLIGASGVFDTLDTFLMSDGKKKILYASTHPADYEPFYSDFIKTTLAERLAMPELAIERTEMMIVALVLIRYVLSLAPFKELCTSEYALKEGMLKKLM